jgi:prefoldin beta subunit
MQNENKIQELQMIEHGLQNLLMQKQAFQIELSETQSALEEIKNSEGEIFKIIGQIMIKSDKKKMLDDLSNKERLLDIRLKSFDKQEKNLSEHAEKIQKEILDQKKK